MIHQRPIVKNVLFCFLFLTIFSSLNTIQAQDGGTLFRSNCGGCHTVNKPLSGPALKDFHKRGKWADRKELYAWVHNPVAYMSKDPYTQGLKAQFNGTMMQGFPNLSTGEIDAIADYLIKASEAPADGGGAGAGGVQDQAAKAQSSDNTLLYGILTLIMAII